MSEVAYILGHSELEMQRLVLQARIIKPFTERLLREAGIGPGMRVLDLGCGAGDVAMLAAELVGPNGVVVGIDRNAGALASARERACQGSYSNICFHHGAVEDFRDPVPFDLAIGRYILMHQANPGAFIRSAASHVRHGGVVAFQEPSLLPAGAVAIAFHEPSLSDVDQVLPTVALHRQCLDWIGTAAASAGARLDSTDHIEWHFRAEGLKPHFFWEIPVGADSKTPILAWVASTVRSVLPQLEKCGAASPEQIDIETLEERLREAVRAANVQVFGFPQMCCWAMV
ncbi:MAG: class I SAM-dependent methyltransferase [Alphaproteobacteria bacterium]|nr:class I SAM-dependent methyltransferase [Alphaproteobacteria bacterium]